MSKNDLESLVISMNKEAEARSLDNGESHDRATIMVLRQHVAALEHRQEAIWEIVQAINEALGELWWVSGTDAKLKIRGVEVLVKKIRDA